MKFKVKYLNSLGKKEERVLKFNSEEELIQSLKKERLQIIAIEVKEGNVKRNRIINNKDLKDKEISGFLKQFSILLKSGIEVKRSVVILKNQEKNMLLRNELVSIDKMLDSGHTLADSFKNTGKFPPLIVGVINAGESSSMLPEALEILSNYYDRELQIKQNLKNALYYPILLLLVTFIVTIAIILFVMPSYIKFFDAYDSLKLPLLTRIVINFGNLIMDYFFIIPIFFILLVIIFKNLKYNKKLTFKLSKIIYNFPILGQYLLNLEVMRFSGIFKLLIKSGLDLIDALDITTNTLNNEYLKKEILLCKRDILSGFTIYESFKKVKLLPDMFLNLVNIGEQASDLESAMDISYNYYKEIIEHQGKKITSLFEPIVIIFVSIIVGTIVLAIALPTFSIVDIL